MKLFIIEHVDHLTESWHGSGGVAVIAKDINAAKKVLDINTVTEEEWANAEVFEIVADKEKSWVSCPP